MKLKPFWVSSALSAVALVLWGAQNVLASPQLSGDGFKIEQVVTAIPGAVTFSYQTPEPTLVPATPTQTPTATPAFTPRTAPGQPATPSAALPIALPKTPQPQDRQASSAPSERPSSIGISGEGMITFYTPINTPGSDAPNVTASGSVNNPFAYTAAALLQSNGGNFSLGDIVEVKIGDGAALFLITDTGNLASHHPGDFNTDITPLGAAALKLGGVPNEIGSGPGEVRLVGRLDKGYGELAIGPALSTQAELYALLRTVRPDLPVQTPPEYAKHDKKMAANMMLAANAVIENGGYYFDTYKSFLKSSPLGKEIAKRIQEGRTFSDEEINHARETGMAFTVRIHGQFAGTYIDGLTGPSRT